MHWHLSHRFDQSARKLADRHYNRHKVGSPQFAPPGQLVALVIPGDAVWCTSWQYEEYVKHAWPGAWVNSLFRNEQRERYLSSELITQAVAATRYYWTAPEIGMITFIDERKTKRKRDPGRCYRRAGFVEVGRTKDLDLVVLQLTRDRMPPAEPPIGATLGLAL